MTRVTVERPGVKGRPLYFSDLVQIDTLELRDNLKIDLLQVHLVSSETKVTPVCFRVSHVPSSPVDVRTRVSPPS